MNRRSFLKWLGVGSAVGAAAPSVLSSMGPACVADYDDRSIGMAGTDWDLEEHPAQYADTTFGQYADYSNFSEFAVRSSIDDMVSETAAKLGRLHGSSISHLVGGG
jgi:hypothetical protein